MKSISKLKTESCKTRFPYTLTVKNIILTVLITTSIQTTVKAQEYEFKKPSWWFGAAGAANFNFYRGSTQKLTNDFTPPTAFHHGNGVGLYVAPLVEFHKPESRWGVMLQGAYDSRKSKFDEITTPCNCPANLSTKLSYISIEPNLRFAPFKSNFYLFAGPRFAFNYNKSFIYKQGTNPNFPDQQPNPDVKGDLSDMNKTIISAQIGAGYDIPLSSDLKRSQFVISPFVSFHPYFGQDPRSIETWNVTTVRAGAALKFGVGSRKNAATNDATKKDDDAPINSAITILETKSEAEFAVNSPKNIPVERRVRETFPIRNYVFFDLGSTQIPDRYILLNKNQVKDFKEDQLEELSPKTLEGRSNRQMIAYYNVLNILGDRMVKNPSTTIILVGSSEKGSEDGKAMAESVKKYLVDVFGITASRIGIEGRTKPKLPSEQPGGDSELILLREGDRRVSIESNSPVLLMEFQTGPDAPLKPIEIVNVQEAPLDSYVSFDVSGAKDPIISWSVEMKDENGKTQKFGPYTDEKKSIPGKAILGTRPSGDYKATMTGVTKSGQTVTKETPVHMVLWTPPINEEGMRFSVIFDFNQSKAIAMYEKYLIDVVVPKIPIDGKVIIHGHTDVIGNDVNNKKLSEARANEVRAIIERGLAKTGRKDVVFEQHGFGEDETLSPFENKYPEERFYNRTVIIDIIPQK